MFMTKEQARAKAKKYREWAKKAQEKHDRLYAEWEQFISGFDWTEPIKQGITVNAGTSACMKNGRRK
jgi:hypothetical protein